jgi:hypothetical protein
MVELPDILDPTLEAIDRAIEAKENSAAHRGYLGMSSVGHSCERKLWYDLRWITKAKFDAATLKRFADGHHGEDLQAARLRLVPGIELHTVDPSTGRQFAYSDHNGHFGGNMDGAILGLIQAPKTWHVFEHKQTSEKKQAELAKLKAGNEKAALQAWNPIYYAQAVLYMRYSGMERHYLTCSSPGGRHTISVRTEPDVALALRLIAKAERVINAPQPPSRISDKPDWWECRMCDHAPVCHGGKLAPAHCRSCLHSTPVNEGQWHCEVHVKKLSTTEQNIGCPRHLYVPGLVNGEQVDADPKGEWVDYLMADGTMWRDGIAF